MSFFVASEIFSLSYTCELVLLPIESHGSFRKHDICVICDFYSFFDSDSSINKPELTCCLTFIFFSNIKKGYSNFSPS